MKKKENSFKTFVGIDISKKTLDICILTEGNNVAYLKETNDKNGIKAIFTYLKVKKIELVSVLFCCENTGVYTMPLSLYLSEKQQSYWVAPAIEIKRSKGISRGKSDKIDAKDIAFYAMTNLYKYKPYALPERDLQELKVLFTEREKVIQCIKQLDTSSENEGFYGKDILKIVLKINTSAVEGLKKSLAHIEKRMKEITSKNEVIKEQMSLITSIPGIGQNTAWYLIVTTNGFKNFSEWRKLACYAGVAPFEYSSGTSVKGRTKVHSLADKKMKSLLHMCALTTIKNNAELKEYYTRKKEEGKPSMLVLNNVKCKLLSRVFAVVNRKQPFVNIFKYAA